MDRFIYRPIGIAHTPFHETEGMPIQPTGATGVKGSVTIFERYSEGLQDLEGFSHIILIYHFHQAGKARLRVRPFLDTELRGVFATRAPVRPNPIGMSVVRLRSVSGHTLHVENVDLLDGTPVLDIKPYVPEFDGVEVESTGWIESKRNQAGDLRSDGRFRPD